jgi:hypothetical protein
MQVILYSEVYPEEICVGPDAVFFAFYVGLQIHQVNDPKYGRYVPIPMTATRKPLIT